jgi:hypothetical protein
MSRYVVMIESMVIGEGETAEDAYSDAITQVANVEYEPALSMADSRTVAYDPAVEKLGCVGGVMTLVPIDSDR